MAEQAKARNKAKIPRFLAATDSLSGYRKWELGVRRVNGPEATLLRVIEKEPEANRRALLSA